MKRVIIDGHGLADQAALVMETIESGPRPSFRVLLLSGAVTCVS